MPLVLGKPGALHSAGCARVLFPEMWRLRGKGKWHGGSVTQLGLSWDTSQAASWMPPREKPIAREKGVSWPGKLGRVDSQAGSSAFPGSFW